MVWVVDNALELVRIITEVALSDPLSLLLVVMGGLVTAFSVLLLAYLALGALVDWLVPDSIGRAPPRQA